MIELCQRQQKDKRVPFSQTSVRPQFFVRLNEAADGCLSWFHRLKKISSQR
jgi:hypothetical protein